MIRALWLTLSLFLVLGLAGCDMISGLTGGDDAGAAGGKAAAKADAGKKAPSVDFAALEAKMAAGDKSVLKELEAIGKEAAHKLTELLKSEDKAKRQAGAFGARAFPGEQHSTALAPVLDAETDEGVAKTLVETLRLSGDPKAVAALVGSLAKPVALKEKIAAVGKLGDKLGEQKGAAEDALIKVAGGDKFRVAAIKVLAKWKSEKALPEMMKIAKKDKNADAQAAALRFVGAVGDKKALKKAVFPALKSKDEGVRIAAIDACVGIGSKSALPKVKKMAKKDKSKKVKKHAKAATKKLKKGK